MGCRLSMRIRGRPWATTERSYERRTGAADSRCERFCVTLFLTTNQRGEPDPADSMCDVGAFELEVGP